MEDSMSESNKDIVIAAWRTFSTRDPKKIEALFTEDAVWIAPPRNGTALALGADEITQMNRKQIAYFIAHDFGRLFSTDVSINFTGIYEEGDTVVLELHVGAILSNGRRYDNDYCFVTKVRNGLISQMREYMDTLSGFRQVFGEEAVKSVSALLSSDLPKLQ
jgi:uncharacterized protein